MTAGTAAATLLDDWKARRVRLAGLPEPRGQVADLHIDLLDYLIRRYHDAPEAARPARYPMQAGLYVNERAIVVHHHLFKDKVAGVKSEGEARERVKSIVERMAAHQAPDAAPPEERPPEEEPFFEFDRPDRSAITLMLWGQIRRKIRRGRDPVPLMRLAIKRDPWFPTSFLTSLAERLGDPQYKAPAAVELLIECENPAGPRYAVRAWHERIARGCIDKVTRRMTGLFRRGPYAARVLEPAREGLAHASAAVRVVTARLLGQIGELDDVGLLSDLLALPPQPDEHPEERRSMLRAMRRISRRGEASAAEA